MIRTCRKCEGVFKAELPHSKVCPDCRVTHEERYKRSKCKLTAIQFKKTRDKLFGDLKPIRKTILIKS